MSGDVQPRRRKDKRRKRDDRKSEGDLNLSRQQSFQDDESSHGVQSANMGSDDQHIHVYQEPHTGGHWCAKILFFALMGVIVVLVGMIIMETRGLNDLDTPLSESRYSDYLHGWVEEHRVEDEHDVVAASIEDHDEHDEPFEEEEEVGEDEETEENNHSEAEGEDGEDKSQTEEAHERDDDNVEDIEEEEVLEINSEELMQDETKESNNNNNNVANNDKSHEDDVDEDENEDDERDNEIADKVVYEGTEEEADESANEDVAAEDDDAAEITTEDADNYAENVVTDDVGSVEVSETKRPYSKVPDDFLDSFDEEDDDFTEHLFHDNDAEEILLLQEKERRRDADNQRSINDEPLPGDETGVGSSYFNRKIKEKPSTRTGGGGPLQQDENDYTYITGNTNFA